MKSKMGEDGTPQTGRLHNALAWCCRWLLRRLPAREVGALLEQLQVEAAGHDPRVGRYALEYNNPQALCFLIDAYPTLQVIFSRYPRLGCIRFLDIGPAFGAAAGLLSQMHRSDFLGPRLQVEALDIVDSRRAFMEMCYPLVKFHHSSVEALPPDAMWDVVFCSNAIEHMDDPRAFIRAVLAHTRGYAVFLAPYREALPLSLDHRLQITEETFEGFAVDSVRVFHSTAWPTTAEGVERQQILAVISASSPV
jgi:SAM-dependent methyltransferase